METSKLRLKYSTYEQQTNQPFNFRGRKDWYRQEYQADFRESKAKTHDGAKETWYKVRDS